MFVITLLTVTLSVACVLLGSSIIIRNSKDPIHRIFFAICIAAAMWAIAFISTYIIYFNPATESVHNLVRYLNRFSLFLGLTIMYLTVLLTFYFPIGRPKKIIRYFTFAALFVGALCFTPYVSGRIKIVDGHFTNPTGSLIGLYLATMAAGVMIIIYNLGIRRGKLSGQQKAQKRLVAISLISSLVAAVSVGVISPIIFPNQRLDALTPMALMLFIIPVANAIKKYRLFDFRAVLVRSVAYVLVLSVLSLVFIGAGLLISAVFIDSSVHLTAANYVPFFVISILLAVSFGPLKKFFDRITRDLFYRDAYDSQDLLNNLNKSLVTTIDLTEVLGTSSAIIKDTLKLSFCAFMIRDTNEQESRKLRIFDIDNIKLDENNVHDLMIKIAHIPLKIIITDDLESKQAYIKESLQAMNIAAVVKLQGQISGRTQHPGFIILGPKISGDTYTTQDESVLEIISDELVIAIQNSLRFEEIQKFNITLREKIEDATKQLRHANTRLKELDQTKDEFISMASHQLRTPLTTIKGYLSMVLEGDVGPVTKNEKQMIQQAFDSAERMVFLIGDLLNVSRLQSGKFVIDNKPTDLIKMINTEVEQLKDTAEHHGLKLICNTPDKLPLFNLDETKIRQVVMNFMDNAIYYTPSGGSITVNLEASPDSITYTVVDTGLGVPKSEQHHLFSKFFRAGNARKMRPDGTGLGLFMAKKVIAAQGGAIVFKSEEGKGSTFGFTFPRHKIELKGKSAEKQPAAAAA